MKFKLLVILIIIISCNKKEKHKEFDENIKVKEEIKTQLSKTKLIIKKDLKWEKIDSFVKLTNDLSSKNDFLNNEEYLLFSTFLDTIQNTPLEYKTNNIKTRIKTIKSKLKMLSNYKLESSYNDYQNAFESIIKSLDNLVVEIDNINTKNKLKSELEKEFK